MNRLRDVMILLSAVAGFAVSLVLFGRFVGYGSPWFALIATLDFLGVVAFGRPLFILRIPHVLYEARAWEARGRVYRALKIPEFGRLLRLTPLRLLNPLVYLNRRAADVNCVLRQIDGAEAAHWWNALLVAAYVLYACAEHWWFAVFGFALLQIAGNLYPIAHLRSARIRLSRLAERNKSAGEPGRSVPRR